MTSVQMHLALTHVPVILSITGLVMLIIAILMKNSTVSKTSYITLAIAGLTALPVFFSGEGAEEAVEHLPGISESIIERHEEVAELGMISIAATGLLALAALFSFRWSMVARVLKYFLLVAAFISGALMIQTASLGGAIRHSEIKNSATAQNGKEVPPEKKAQEDGDSQEDHDND